MIEEKKLKQKWNWGKTLDEWIPGEGDDERAREREREKRERRERKNEKRLEGLEEEAESAKRR